MTRVLLTAATLGVVLGLYALMLKGWRGRRARWSQLPAPERPTSSDASVAPVAGLFVGTTSADHWLDRVNAHHLSDRSTGVLTVTEEGVAVERPRLPALLVPNRDLVSADVETGLGGKVVSTGMLVLTWRLGSQLLRTAFRADDRHAHETLLDALTDRIALEAAR